MKLGLNMVMATAEKYMKIYVPCFHYFTPSITKDK